MATGEVVYIGKGQGDRLRHAFTGRSHSAELNRLHFQGVPLMAEALEVNLDNRQATIHEARLIEKHNPRFNAARGRLSYARDGNAPGNGTHMNL